VGVVAAGAQREAAENYARYLAGPSTSNRIRSDREFPMLATRNAQLGQGIADPRSAPGVDPRGWAVAVGSTMNAVRVVVGLRIPGASGYLSDLSAGRLAALGGAAPEKALANVAERWDARTEALGRERQLWHYRRSLNNLVTTPEPPARPSK
jgi:hypothetical protein